MPIMIREHLWTLTRNFRLPRSPCRVPFPRILVNVDAVFPVIAAALKLQIHQRFVQLVKSRLELIQ